MAKTILDIVIKTVKDGGGDVETVKALNNVKSTIMGTAAVAGTLVAAGYTIEKGFDATVGALVAYAEEVRRVQNATGATAEDSSKLIQILDDQKISYEQLEKAVQKSGKTYDFSIKGIAGMSEQYLKLTDSNQQAAFMQERFGKQWISFIPIMKQGKQAILDSADAVEKGLIINQDALDQTREYEIALDAWNDSVQALKVSIGTELLPVVTRMTIGLSNSSEISKEANRLMQEGIATNRVQAVAMATTTIQEQKLAEAMKQGAGAQSTNTSATEDATEAAKKEAEALKEVSKAHEDMLGTIGKVASAEQSYEETSKGLTEERIRIEGERAAALAAGWWEGSEKIKDFDLALEENGAKAEENAAKHHEAMGKIQYDLLLTKLSADGLTDAEFAIAQQAGLMFGVFDQKSVATAGNLDAIAKAVDSGVISVDQMRRAIELIPQHKNIEVVLNILAKMNNANTFLSGSHTTQTQQTQQGGYAAGGVSSGPDSGHWELLHGTEAVIPLQGGAVPVQMSGGGGSNYYVNLTIASPMTIMDEQNVKNTLLPFIVDGIRTAKAQGAIK